MDAGSHREQIYDAFADADGDFADQISLALDVGTEYLDLPIGFLTRIDGETQEIVHATGEHELIQPGETCPLERAYCRRTVEIDGPLAVQSARDSASISTAAFETFELGTYIGTQVLVNDDIYGTVCFADEEVRDQPFSEADEMFLELLARLIGQGLERRAHERELRQRNERLKREKRRFEGIAETSFDILFRVDRDATFTYVSSAVERNLGYAPDELVGEPFSEYIRESSNEDALDAYSQVLNGQTVESVELDFLDVNGEPVVLEINASPIEDDGEIVGAQGVGRDVTARKERERELRIKNRAMDEARIGISIADNGRPDRPLVYVNGGFERLTGYDADEVLGRNCRFLQGPATDPDTIDQFREHIDAGEPLSVEVLNYRKDGTPFWNQVRISPVADDGDVTHYLGFQADITERKRTEQLVHLLNRVLRHNLRNDMNVLLGVGEMLREGRADDIATLGGEIRDTAESLVELSDRARELEKYAQRERNPKRLDPRALLDDVALAYRERHPSATIELDVRTDDGICAGREVKRAVAELVENALKHNPSDAPWVEVVAVEDGEWVELTVEDDGPGIDEMETKTVATGNETALEHGSGLGLWLVNWIVTRYGGSFQIRATEGTGSIATVRLPRIGSESSVESVARPPTVLFR